MTKILKFSSWSILCVITFVYSLSILLPILKMDNMSNKEVSQIVTPIPEIKDIVFDKNPYIEEVLKSIKEETDTEIESDKKQDTTDTENNDDKENIDNIYQEETIDKNINEIKCTWGNFTITRAEFELICTTIFCEAGNQNIETQVMACLTILNRYVAGYGSIHDIIYAPNAYTVTNWDNFENRGWTEQVEKAVTYALRVNKYPRDMLYFRNGYYHTFHKAEDYKQSGDLYFSTRKD